MNVIAKTQYFIAATIGAFFSAYAGLFWIYYAANHPINRWLIDTLLTQGNEVGYFIAIYTHDLLVNVILALPAAILLTIVKPEKPRVAMMLAVLGALFVNYWSIFADPTTLLLFAKTWSFYVNLVTATFCIPLAWFIWVSFRPSANAA